MPQEASAKYLAKWSYRELAKPTDRSTGKIKDWIDAVFVKKRFYDPAAHASPRLTSRSQVTAFHKSSAPELLAFSSLTGTTIQGTTSSRATSEYDVPIQSVSEALGNDMTRLQVSLHLCNAQALD